MMSGKAEKQVEVQKENSLILQFPVEITTDILSRLPVDSLIRQCKLVCKTWRSLIEDLAFVDVHTRHLLRVLDDCNSASSDIDAEASVTTDFILSLQQRQPRKASSGYQHIIFQIGKYINPEMGFQVSKPLNTKNLDQCKRRGIVGSSNGLICLSSSEDISVYNPCTNEYVDLPRPRFRTITDEQYNVASMAAGFGYSPCTKEYKIVLICYKPYDQEGTHKGEVSVYTLGTGKWRIKEEDISQKCTGYRLFTSGVLMNRAIHWTMWSVPRNADDSKYEIVSFDLTDEEFRRNIVPSPPPVKLLGSQLTLFGGCLCVTQRNIASITMDIRVMDIWVMNNKDKTWTVKFKIPTKNNKKFRVREYFIPIARLGKSKILVFYRPTGKLSSYDTETGNIVEVNNDYGLVSGIIPYKIKSFVSLKALGEDACKMMYI